MFIFRLIRKLIFVAVIAAVTLYVANYEYRGKKVQQYVQEAWKSGLISEGFKDIKTWIAEIFRVGNKVTKDQLTEKDKSQLESILKSELKENVEKIKEEAQKLNLEKQKAEPQKNEGERKTGGK